MSILVTGGAGFIGSHVCEALLRKGQEVVCVDNFDPYYGKELKLRNLKLLEGKKGFNFQKLDVRDANLKNKLKKSRVEKIIHLAARPGVRPSIADPYIYQEINVGGTLNMLEFAAKMNVENFVFISSSSIYGNSPQIPWKESCEPLPASPYGASKLAGEAFVRSYSELYGLKTSCLRYFSVYGPRQRPDLAIAKFTKNILAGKPIEMFGNGSTMRDYTYISDAVDGTLAALNKKFGFEIFNIGDSNPLQLSELIKLLEQNLERRAIIRKRPEQSGDLKHTYADLTKSRRMLGYSPKVKVQEGIREYIKWHLKNVS